MATKLKNMRLTSVDLVRAGANQEADICLFKSADPQEATDSPTVAEKNIFKRFLNWFHENHQEAEIEPDTGIEKADEEPEPSDIFKSAIIESLQSIIADDNLSADEKNSMIEKSICQYHEKMLELAKGEDSEPSDYFFEDLEKANPYHAADGKFTTAAGSGGSASDGALPSLTQKQIGSLQAHGISSYSKDRGMDSVKSDAMRRFDAMNRGGAKRAASVGVYETGNHYHTVAERSGANKKILEAGGKKIGYFDASGRYETINKSADIDEIEEI